MRNLTRIYFMLLALVSVSFDVEAKGLVGQRFIAISGGIINPGDDLIEEIDDSILTYGMGINLPVIQNLDLQLSISRAELDGDLFGVNFEEDDTVVSGGILYHFSPGEQFNPYIFGSLSYIDFDAELGVTSIEDDEMGFGLGIGGETNLTNDFSFTFDVTYSDVFDNDALDDETTAALTLHKWLAEHIGLAISLAYAFDDEDVGYSGSFTVGF